MYSFLKQSRKLTPIYNFPCKIPATPSKMVSKSNAVLSKRGRFPSVKTFCLYCRWPRVSTISFWISASMFWFFIRRSKTANLVWNLVYIILGQDHGRIRRHKYWSRDTTYSTPTYTTQRSQRTYSTKSKASKMHILTNKHRIVFEVELIDKCHLN